MTKNESNLTDHFANELEVISVNYQVMLRSNTESLRDLASMSMDLIKNLKSLESD